MIQMFAELGIVLPRIIEDPAWFFGLMGGLVGVITFLATTYGKILTFQQAVFQKFTILDNKINQMNAITETEFKEFKSLLTSQQSTLDRQVKYCSLAQARKEGDKQLTKERKEREDDFKRMVKKDIDDIRNDIEEIKRAINRIK